jgi:cyclohexyl-isocyanide hydratase
MSSFHWKVPGCAGNLDRRAFLNSIPIAAAALYASPASAAIDPEDLPAPPPQQGHGEAIPNMMGSEQIAMLLYPGFTALDLVGPHFFLSGLMGAKVHLVTNQATLDPVVSDAGLAVTPSARLQDMPAHLDVIFVPGGFQGTLAAMTHAPTLEFLKAASVDARVVTSVCTGSFILAAAGLLKGRRATSHWVARDTLAAFGATPVDERVVRDGKFITGAGISAGLDSGLAVVEALRGRPYAEAQMLQAEYAPAPPFPGGRPETTAPAITSAMQGMLGAFNARARAIAG